MAGTRPRGVFAGRADHSATASRRNADVRCHRTGPFAPAEGRSCRGPGIHGRAPARSATRACAERSGLESRPLSQSGLEATVRFENKVAIVTGSAGGIGEAYARALAREGAAVVVADIDATRGKRRSPPTSRRMAGARSSSRPTSARSKSADAAAEAAMQAFGRLDYLVNNAALFAGMRLDPLDRGRPRLLPAVHEHQHERRAHHDARGAAAHAAAGRGDRQPDLDRGAHGLRHVQRREVRA